MEESPTLPTMEPNRRIGSIEYVGSDGFIVEAYDPHDPDFFEGKRIFMNFDDLLRFLAKHLRVYKSPKNLYGMERDRKPTGIFKKMKEEESYEDGEPRKTSNAGGL